MVNSEKISRFSRCSLRPALGAFLRDMGGKIAGTRQCRALVTTLLLCGLGCGLSCEPATTVGTRLFQWGVVLGKKEYYLTSTTSDVPPPAGPASCLPLYLLDLLNLSFTIWAPNRCCILQFST